MYQAGIVLLAAGESRRMGAPKQLLKFGGRSLICRTAETALASRCSPVIVALGAYADEVRAELEGLSVRCVINSVWRTGMGSSISAGIRELTRLSGDALDAVVLSVCDQPLLSAAIVDGLIRAATASPGAIVASAYGGIVGCPVLFPRSKFEELSRLSGVGGARELLRAAGEMIEVPFPGGEVDLDVPEDYEACCGNRVATVS